MKIDRVTWRLGWLAAGLVGLVALTLLPRHAGEPPPSDQAALVEALWNLNEARVERLLERGIGADSSLDARQTRPLHVLFFGPGCSLRQRPTVPVTGRIARLLIEHGADVDAADARGNTPLMLAAAECDAAVVRLLLGAGADMYQTNMLGLTAFELTLANVSDAAEALLDFGFRLTPEAADRYRRIYHDEPRIIALVARASE